MMQTTQSIQKLGTSPGRIFTNQSGYTLMEISMTLFIMFLTGCVIVGIYVGSMEIYSTISLMSESNSGANRVSGVMLKDIRQVRDRSSITEAKPDVLTFTNIQNDLITYKYLAFAKKIHKQTTRGTTIETDTTFFSNLSDFMFVYKDADGTTLQTDLDPLNLIRKIQLIFVDSSNVGVGVYTSKCYLRNLR